MDKEDIKQHQRETGELANINHALPHQNMMTTK